MRLNLFFLFGIGVLASAPFSFAGPLFPCPTAVSSVHGNALAIVHNTVEWNGNTGKLLRVQFTVMSKIDFLNDYQKIVAPLGFWGYWAWGVVSDRTKQTDLSFSMSCAVPLVTDDGEFLVLLATGPVFASVMRIYRKGPCSDRTEDGTVKGVLVKEIKIDELWPAAKIDPTGIWTDHTPEWFAFGTFDFSPDNLQLIHKTRWGNTVRINLSDGKVTKEYFVDGESLTRPSG